MITINVRHAIFFMLIGAALLKGVEHYVDEFEYEEFKTVITSRL